MPTTTVAKMVGAITTLTSLMNRSASHFIFAPVSGANTPMAMPTAMPSSTQKYRWCQSGFRFRRTTPGASPYRLYALSNVGSLLARALPARRDAEPVPANRVAGIAAPARVATIAALVIRNGRVQMIDRHGALVDGDQLLYVLATDWHASGRLRGPRSEQRGEVAHLAMQFQHLIM